MPTSDPGISENRALTPISNLRGFTLVEVLVVLLIMGLLAGLAVGLTRPDDRAVLRVEAERLAQLLDLAAAESRFTGNTMAWTADGPGYRFWRMSEDAGWPAQWSEIADADLLRARVLPPGVLVSALQVAGEPAQGSMRLAFTPHGPALPFSIEMSLGAARYAVAASAIGELSVSPR
jgi:general secretion pathway protein H